MFVDFCLYFNVLRDITSWFVFIRAAPPPSNVPARAPPSTPATVAAGQPQQPSLFGQMAATAGGVAVGSAVVCEVVM